jgi:hypothetical protein
MSISASPQDTIIVVCLPLIAVFGPAITLQIFKIHRDEKLLVESSGCPRNRYM